MKIIREQEAFLQTKDIMYLIKTEEEIPSFIEEKLPSNNSTNLKDINRFDFIRFTNPLEIEYISMINWVLDYEEVKELEMPQLLEMYSEKKEEFDATALVLNSLVRQKRPEQEEFIEMTDKIKYEMNSIKNIIGYKLGHVHMNIPRESQKEKPFVRVLEFLNRKTNEKN